MCIKLVIKTNLRCLCVISSYTDILFSVSRQMFFFLFSLCFDSVLIATLIVVEFLRIWYKASC
jgi:hypothetical protein